MDPKPREKQHQPVMPSDIVLYNMRYMQLVALYPYTMSFDEVTRTFTRRTTKIRKGIFILLFLCGQVYIFTKGLVSIGASGGPKLVSWNFCIYFCWLVHHSTTGLNLLLNSDKLLECLNQTYRITETMRRSFGMKPSSIVCKYVPLLLCTTQALYILMDSAGLNLQIDHVGISTLIPPVLPKYEPGSTSQIWNATCTSYPCFSRDVPGITWQLLLFSTNMFVTVMFQLGLYNTIMWGIATWVLVDSFMGFLEQSNVCTYQHRVRTLDLLDEISVLFQLINEAFGTLMLISVLAVFPFYVMKLVRILNGGGKFLAFYCYHLMTLALFFIPAASSNSKLKGFVKWLQKMDKLRARERRMTSVRATTEVLYSGRVSKWEDAENDALWNHRVQLLLHEISSNCIGFKGRLFTFTYSFLGEVVGLIVTYTIIVMQLSDDA